MGCDRDRIDGFDLHGNRTLTRVLVVSHSFLQNDPRVNRAVSAFVEEGWAVEGLFLDQPIREPNLRTWRVPIARRQGSAVRYAFEYGMFFLWMFIWVLIRCLRHRPDVVYVNSPPDVFAVAALPAKMFGARIVLDIHDPMPELLVAKGRDSSLLFRMLALQERMGIAAADRLITVHEPLADVLNARSPDEEFDIVMNVPDPAGWPPIERRGDSRVIVFTGTVARRYGLDDIVDAVAAVCDEIPSIALKVIGDGEDLDRLRTYVVRQGIGDRVEFVGRVPYGEIRSHLSDAWLGANVPKPDSLGELSFSNKVVEWTSIGLPVLAADTKTMRRYFPEGTLFYTTGGDAAQIAERLREIDAMSASDIHERVTAAQQALDAIAWPVQRTNLIDIVAEEASR